LYRTGQAGQYGRLACQVRGSIFDCGKYTPDSVMTIEGTWMRQQVPAGEVVHPGGRVEVIAWRTVSFLLVGWTARHYLIRVVTSKRRKLLYFASQKTSS
jgi:hypothetical protein